ncbi:MAG: Lar family restriction alleviation protein [Oscillospiraceae bacterium]|nr:Lar family restriction alleviation protein [Oscillospiraceae bacterium]
MAELKPCPFCEGESETHRRRSSCRFFADSKKSIPKNGKLERTIEYPDGHKRYEYSKAEWVPRCMDSSCIGRVTKAFPSEEEAIEAWNRRANDGQHS